MSTARIKQAADKEYFNPCKISPRNWMRHLPDSMTPKTITWFGGHDSITDFNANNLLSPSLPLPSALRWLMNHVGFIDNIARKQILNWSEAQCKSAKEQLHLGARYFDLRVALNEIDNKLYTVHGLFSNDTLETTLKEISTFIDDNPSELVILDFRNFHNMNNKASHDKLFQLLKDRFNDKLTPASLSLDSPLTTFRNANKNVIAIYHSNNVYSKNPDPAILWPGNRIDSLWPNKTDVKALTAFLDNQIKTQPINKLNVTQGVLTPDTWMTIKGFLFGWIPGLGKWAPTSLKDLAKMTNPELEKELSGNWQNSHLNILILDHIQLTNKNFIEKIVLRNLKTASRHTQDISIKSVNEQEKTIKRDNLIELDYSQDDTENDVNFTPSSMSPIL